MKYILNCIFVSDGESFTAICDDVPDLFEKLDETYSCYEKELMSISIVSVKES